MSASDAFNQDIGERLAGLREEALYKTERVITTPQAGQVALKGEQPVINLCANNYLGLADSPELIETAKVALDRYGYGMASVRFICGTQEEHKELEGRLARFLGFEDAILYSSCFDANTGLFETLLGPEDAIISDALNHASIIDGIRLCKAQRFRYANSDMGDLEDKLKQAAGARHRLIATDGVFSMDGYYARLRHICDLAEKYDAMVMVDDSHAVGFVGDGGHGPGRYHDGNARQGAGRRVGRLHRCQPRNRRLASAALSPLSVFEYAGAGHSRDLDRGAEYTGRGRQPACPPLAQRRAFSRQDG